MYIITITKSIKLARMINYQFSCVNADNIRIIYFLQARNQLTQVATNDIIALKTVIKHMSAFSAYMFITERSAKPENTP